MVFERETILKYRRILKVFDDDIEMFPEDFLTDQQKKIFPPPLQKPYSEDAKLIDLMPIEEISCGKKTPLFDSLKKRKSHRFYSEEALSLDELSFLLWATQGVHTIDEHHGASLKRTVPSGGSRHPFETYLIINNVKNIDPGIYRYLGIEHKLLFMKSLKTVDQEEFENIVYQPFILKGAAIFIWAAFPYRMEWRYSITSSKVIAIEAGHICQNLYLACEALGLGTCAIASYNQEIADKILELDGDDEFTIYLAPVGKLKE